MVALSRPNRIIGYRKNGRPIYEIAGGDGSTNPVLERLYEQRDKQISFVEELTEKAEAEGRSFTESELANLNSAREIVEGLNPQIKQIEDFETLREATEKATRRLSGGGERRESRPATRTNPREQYRSAGEFILDVTRAYNGDEAAASRVRDSGRGSVLDPSVQERAVAGDTTANSSGVLPAPIIGQIVSDVDASRPLITSLGPHPMAGIPGTSFSRPVVTQHTASGAQSAELAELPSQAFVVSGVPFTKKTYGGSLQVSRQNVDFTQPAVFDAIIRDLQEQFAIQTEAAVAADFEAAATNTAVAVASNDLTGWASALYGAAGSVYAGCKHLPDRVWASIDMWEKLGPITDVAVLQRPDTTNSSLDSFAGNLFKLPRIVVPEFASGQTIVGYSSRYEVYEDRIGLIQAIKPSILGVEIAYGGYVAFKALNGAAFTELTPPV